MWAFMKKGAGAWVFTMCFLISGLFRSSAVSADMNGHASETVEPQLQQQLDELNERALTLSEEARYPEASRLYQEALQLVERSVGPSDPRTAVYLNRLAFIHQRQGHYPPAQSLFQRALDVKGQAFG